jgi:hypothetical protein
MESKGSLPCSRKSSASPSQKPDKLSPQQSQLMSIRSILILSSHLHLGLTSAFSLQVSNQTFVYVCHLPYARYMLRPSHPHSGMSASIYRGIQFSPVSCINLPSVYTKTKIYQHKLGQCQLLYTQQTQQCNENSVQRHCYG